MRRKHVIIALVLVVCLAIGVVAALAARDCAKAGMAGPGKGLGACVQELKLTPAQIVELIQIRTELMNSTESQRLALQANTKELIALATAETPDAAAIDSKAKQADAERTELRSAMIQSAVKAMGVLTPEQRVKVRAKIATMGDKVCGILGGGMGFGCGQGAGAGAGCPLGTAPVSGTSKAPARGGCCPGAKK